MEKKSILLGKSKRVKRKFQGLNLLLELLNSILQWFKCSIMTLILE